MTVKTMAEYYADVRRLAERIGDYRPDIIAPCLVGGLFPGMILSYKLGVSDVRPIDIQRQGERRWLSYPIEGDVTGKSILIVEDDLPTGKGPAVAKEQFIDQGAREVRIAAVYVTPEGRDVADFWVEEFDEIPDYEWKGSKIRDRVTE